jgi:hypothetical protein
MMWHRVQIESKKKASLINQLPNYRLTKVFDDRTKLITEVHIQELFCILSNQRLKQQRDTKSRIKVVIYHTVLRHLPYIYLFNKYVFIFKASKVQRRLFFLPIKKYIYSRCGCEMSLQYSVHVLYRFFLEPILTF